MNFECFGYSLKKYNNSEMLLAQHIKAVYYKKVKAIKMQSYQNENIRYWVIPASNMEFYLIFDENFDIANWDFVSNTGITNKLEFIGIEEEINKENDFVGTGFANFESNICPLNVCVVNLDSLSKEDLNKKIDMELTIFTDEIDIYKDKIHFENKLGKKTDLAAESIIPIGQFRDEHPSMILLNGKVVSIQKNMNDLEYYSMVIETLGMKFNVFTTAKIGRKININNILSLKGILFGKTMKKPSKIIE